MVATAEEEAEQLRDQYRLWRLHLKAKQMGFFAVYAPFVESEFFAKLSPGATKLYLYLGRYARNYTGELYHPISRMAKALDVSQRTVKTWADELEDKGLIKRLRPKAGKVAHTFLLPYSPVPQTEEPSPKEGSAQDDNESEPNLE